MTGLFIGVVSHTRSRFAGNQGPDGFAAQLAAQMTSRGVPSSVHVNTVDLWEPSIIPLTSTEARESERASLESEESWQQYLDAAGSISLVHKVRHRLIMEMRRVRLRVRHALRGSAGEASQGVAALQRLVNIELSHVDLWRRGISSGAPWILILEDDAVSPDIIDCAEGLASLLEDLACGGDPSYINVSQSFDSQELGTTHLLSPSALPWRGRTSRTILKSSRPITNTVCAVLYRGSFLCDLLETFASMPMAPVIPIDFKLNEALQIQYAQGVLHAGSCWQVEPAPIVQMSMHSVR